MQATQDTPLPPNASSNVDKNDATKPPVPDMPAEIFSEPREQFSEVLKDAYNLRI